MRDYKTKRKNTNKSVNYYSKLTARDLRFEKLEHVTVLNQTIFDLGYSWCEQGNLLEDAPTELRDNTNFINGFNKAYRLKKINADLMELGRKLFYEGKLLEEGHASLKNNPYFIKGYDDAMNESNMRSR